MPVFNFFHWSKDRPEVLQESGPIIPVEVRLPTALHAYYAENGMNIPAPVVGHALIDTGAFATAVDEKVFRALGITAIDTMATNTPHGPGTSNIYPANISFPALDLTNLPLERVIGANLRWKTADGKEIIMLLGRDLLKYFLLVYNGKSFDITLAY